jgi:hypothetical protein
MLVAHLVKVGRFEKVSTEIPEQFQQDRAKGLCVGLRRQRFKAAKFDEMCGFEKRPGEKRTCLGYLSPSAGPSTVTQAEKAGWDIGGPGRSGTSRRSEACQLDHYKKCTWLK